MAVLEMKLITLPRLTRFKSDLDTEYAGKFDNKIDKVQVNGTDLVIAGKTVNITMTEGTTDGTMSVNGVDVAFHGANDLFTKVATLIGADANKSVRTIAAEELAAQLIPANAKESMDTLAELAAWMQAHPDDAAAMNLAITALQNICAGIGGEGQPATVAAYVAAEIAKIGIGDYYTKTEADGKFVAKEDGKALISAADQLKLDGIAAGAQVNVLEGVKVDGVALTVGADKTVDITLSTQYVAQEVNKSLMSQDEHDKLAGFVEATDSDIDAIFGITQQPSA